MNTKRALLFTALMCASPVLNMVASADSMYKDLLKYVGVGCYYENNICEVSSAWQIESIQAELLEQYKPLTQRLISLHLRGSDYEIEQCKKEMDKIIKIMQRLFPIYEQLREKERKATERMQQEARELAVKRREEKQQVEMVNTNFIKAKN